MRLYCTCSDRPSVRDPLPSAPGGHCCASSRVGVVATRRRRHRCGPSTAVLHRPARHWSAPEEVCSSSGRALVAAAAAAALAVAAAADDDADAVQALRHDRPIRRCCSVEDACSAAGVVVDVVGAGGAARPSFLAEVRVAVAGVADVADVADDAAVVRAVAGAGIRENIYGKREIVPKR